MGGVVKRIIPCLDIDNGRAVKGVNFKDLKDAGDVVELAQFYSQEGADELVLLDINSSGESRQKFLALVKQAASKVTIPLIVGGGINSVGDAQGLFALGVAKVTLGSMGVKEPSLIEALAKEFGSSRVVCAIDAKGGEVYIGGGREATGLKVDQWVQEVERRGAGEILLTSMDKDGTKSGFDLELTKACSQLVKIPIIASGGGGEMEHFRQILTEGGAQAALAASIFHYREISIRELKIFLDKHGISIRLNQ
ncbi:MAG: imidazole glycerol phosphate synthase subunit HisF [Spirochaetales bacterium]|nr:imidazole glycerol phosphate synthase subunit HisF [Spirochaetales bacterium]